MENIDYGDAPHLHVKSALLTRQIIQNIWVPELNLLTRFQYLILVESKSAIELTYRH